MDTALDRDALYYPYIHLHDVNWLKGALLCFPQVRRMVPPDFYLNDSPAIQEFRKIKGARNEPLIAEEDTDQPAVEDAQQRLLVLLQQNEELVRERYSKDAAMRQHPQVPGSIRVHRGKMIAELVDYLQSRQLAWCVEGTRGGYAPWYMLHPKLGEALMSVIAINIALHKGLDIVTSSGPIHHALASLDEQEAFRNLIGQTAPEEPMQDSKRASELTDELALMVMTSYFDLTRLSATQIAELIKDGKDLRRFKTALVPIAQALPDAPDPVERQKRLESAAKEVISEWNKYKKSLPWFAVDALLEVPSIKAPEFVLGMIAGAGTGVTLAAGVGLAVGIVVYSGCRIIRTHRDKMNDPYQFLCRVEKAGASLITRPEFIGTTGGSAGRGFPGTPGAPPRR